MFDVGFAELFLLALIGLLVLGPERLPGVARTVGGYVRKARSSWISLRNTIEAELAEADISAPMKQVNEELKQIGKDLADMPGLNMENDKPEIVEAETISPETSEVETAAPEPTSIDTQTSEPVPDTDSEKSKDV